MKVMKRALSILLVLCTVLGRIASSTAPATVITA